RLPLPLLLVVAGRQRERYPSRSERRLQPLEHLRVVASGLRDQDPHPSLPGLPRGPALGDEAPGPAAARHEPCSHRRVVGPPAGGTPRPRPLLLRFPGAERAAGGHDPARIWRRCWEASSSYVRPLRPLRLHPAAVEVVTVSSPPRARKTPSPLR